MSVLSIMEWGGKLNRQRSCACPAVARDIGYWCNRSGRRRSDGLSRMYTTDGSDYDEDEEEEFEPLDYAAGRASTPRWRIIWRRIVKGKRRIFDSGAPIRVSYDPYTYAQNFDQGTIWLEPENLSRSFSARFADPSRILRSN